MRKWGLPLVITLCLVTACAGGESSGPGASPTSTGSVTTSATSDTSAATTRQYASLVAKESATIEKQLERMTGPDCDWTSPANVDVDPASLVCGLGVLTTDLQAQTLALVLRGAQKPGVPAFIGAPPAEIAPLVTATVKAADDLHAASETANPCTVDPGPNCRSALFEFSKAMEDMQSQLAAWGPYGG